MERESKLKDVEFQLNNATKNIKHLEGLIHSHEEETKETDSQFENVKQLHAEHCKEYEFQIENLQQQVRVIEAVGRVLLRASKMLLLPAMK